MADPLEPEVVDAPPQPAPKKKARLHEPYKIRRLPLAVRVELDRRLSDGNYASFQELSRWLQTDHHREISPQSLHLYYRTQFDPLLKSVKMATLQAAEIMRVTGANDDLNMSTALLRLVQTAIFDVLVEFNKAKQMMEGIPGPKNTRNNTAADKLKISAVNALGKTTALVGKAIFEVQILREELRDKLNEKIAATTARVSDAARDAGISPEVEKTIRDALMEIKV